jgi:hypothetical protein
MFSILLTFNTLKILTFAFLSKFYTKILIELRLLGVYFDSAGVYFDFFEVLFKELVYTN